ncbi:MAG: hypothetical protein CMH30_08610 [Micavibrio sp.]|nr:hypothetical protein [Micavibrio sp.]|tara:strand:- start:1573 stop:1995 length:423 start_codon:yes stop_codon:yes gene_type:complete
MADLSGLIRFRKHQLDEKQKFLAMLYVEADRLLQEKEVVLGDIEREKNAFEDPEFVAFTAISSFGHFLKASKKKIQDIEQRERTLDTRIQIAMNDMREGFADFKKVEITHKRRLEAARKKFTERENKVFEEIALNIFRNK